MNTNQKQLAVLGRMYTCRASGPCRCCGTRPGNRRRGLCGRCYLDPNARALFPSIAPRGRRGQTGQGPRKMPRPTRALPGTPEKVRVLAERFARGEELYHPLDARRPPGGTFYSPGTHLGGE